MRIIVDLNRCQSYAQCCFLAPKTFQFLGEEALVYDPEPDDAQRENIVRAAAACPVHAIFIEHALEQQKKQTSGSELSSEEREYAK